MFHSYSTNESKREFDIKSELDIDKSAHAVKPLYQKFIDNVELYNESEVIRTNILSN